MGRGTELSEAIHALATEPVLLLAAVVTLTGDAATLLAIAVGLYWLGSGVQLAGSSAGPSNETGIELDRRRGAFVIACVLGALSLTAGLKALFSFPRPSVPVVAPDAFAALPFAAVLRAFVDWAASASGYGFPSGHAVGSVVTYGALALTLTVSTQRRRWITASTVIGLVSLSRVALEVHYLVDVLVGIAVGLAYLAGVTWVARTDRGVDARRAFALAVLVGALGMVAGVTTVGLDTGTARDAVTLSGVSVGAGAGWLLAGAPTTPAIRRERIGTVLVGVVVAGVPGLATYVLDPALPIEFAASVGVGAAAILAPQLTKRGMAALGVVSRSDQNVSR